MTRNVCVRQALFEFEILHPLLTNLCEVKVKWSQISDIYSGLF